MKCIELTRGKVALVDDSDFPILGQFKWSLSGNGKYAVRGLKDKKVVYMHREIMNTPKGMDTDHINGDGLDNRRENLRVCSHGQNVMNTSKWKKPTTSDYRGVSWSGKYQNWVCRVVYKRKLVFNGHFDSEINAAVAWDLWAKDLYGEFATLNFKSI